MFSKFLCDVPSWNRQIAYISMGGKLWKHNQRWFSVMKKKIKTVKNVILKNL
jgi:hypothetical protein